MMLCIVTGTNPNPLKCLWLYYSSQPQTKEKNALRVHNINKKFFLYWFVCLNIIQSGAIVVSVSDIDEEKGSRHTFSPSAKTHACSLVEFGKPPLLPFLFPPLTLIPAPGSLHDSESRRESVLYTHRTRTHTHQATIPPTMSHRWKLFFLEGPASPSN